MKKLFRRLLSPIVHDILAQTFDSLKYCEPSDTTTHQTDYTPEIVNHTLISEEKKNVTKSEILKIIEIGLLEYPYDKTFDEARIFVHLSESQKAHKSAAQ